MVRFSFKTETLDLVMNGKI